MNTPQDYLNTLEGFPENQSLLDKDNLCSLMEGYWEWRESKEWIKIEDGLPEVNKDVEVITEYFDKGKPATQRFLGYMDEYGELITLPEHDGYGWQFNDCVAWWRKLAAIPK